MGETLRLKLSKKVHAISQVDVMSHGVVQPKEDVLFAYCQESSRQTRYLVWQLPRKHRHWQNAVTAFIADAVVTQLWLIVRLKAW